MRNTLYDSKGDLGSKKDRHEVIGQGFLGLETFKRLLRHPKFSEYPLILETPDIKSDVIVIPESLLIVKDMV